MSYKEPNEIFTPDEKAQNEKKKKELSDIVLSGEAILFVGAGCSIPLGYSSWEKLLLELEQLVKKIDGDFQIDERHRQENPLSYIQKIKCHIKEKTGSFARYHNFVVRQFNPQDTIKLFNDLHKDLIFLPFKGIITTNYDHSLEFALKSTFPEKVRYDSYIIQANNAHLVSEFLLSLDKKNELPSIAHMHGSYKSTESIILSLDEYNAAYGWDITKEMEFSGTSKTKAEIGSKWTLHRKLLWAILATRRVVFVGFSMSDPYLNAMLETVSNDLWNWDQSIHYAITSISPENASYSKYKMESLKMDYGVEVVFYEDLDATHSGLYKMLSEMAEKHRQAIASEKEEQVYYADVEVTETEGEKIDRIIDKKDSSEWIVKVNERMIARINPDENKS